MGARWAVCIHTPEAGRCRPGTLRSAARERSGSFAISRKTASPSVLTTASRYVCALAYGGKSNNAVRADGPPKTIVHCGLRFLIRRATSMRHGVDQT